MDDTIIINTFFKGKSKRFTRNYLKIIETFSEIKSYLDLRFDDITDYKEIIYRIKGKIESTPLCPECGKQLKFIGIKNIIYQTYCSQECQRKYMNVKMKTLDYSYRKNYEYNKIIQDKRKCKIDLIKLKTKQTLLEQYGDEHYNNRKKFKQTCIEKYGVTNVMQNDEIKNKVNTTCLDKYGTSSPLQNKEIHKRTIETQYKLYGGPFNKSKTKQTCLEKYGVETPFQSKETQNKTIETKRKNNTFNTSKPESGSYTLLCNKFGEENIIKQYKSELYPFNCDFYIKQLDMYIECNYHWTHGPHPYDENNPYDTELLEKWKSKNNKFYNHAIKVWTERDPLKINTAKTNNLNYKTFYTIDELKLFLEVEV